MVIRLICRNRLLQVMIRLIGRNRLRQVYVLEITSTGEAGSSHEALNASTLVRIHFHLPCFVVSTFLLIDLQSVMEADFRNSVTHHLIVAS